MYGLPFALAILLVVAGLAAQFTSARAERDEEVATDHAVAQLSVYGRYVGRYAAANPGVNGAVSDSLLALPDWYVRFSTLANVVQGGRGYVYLVPPRQGDGFVLAGRFGPDARVGVKIAGRLIMPGTKADAGALPASIPDGAVVYAY